MPRPGTHLRAALCAKLPFTSLIHQRSICRLRAGLHNLGHNDGHRSSASCRACIFCNTQSRALFWHAFFDCPAFARERLTVPTSSVSSFEERDAWLEKLLSTGPDVQHFAAVARLAHAIEVAECTFWARENSNNEL
jgi:hypothetical protein